MANQRTIIKGLLIVPIAEQYIFKRSPEIMEWFTSLGYGFHGRHDDNAEYVSIIYKREQELDLGFANCNTANDAMLNGRVLSSKRHFDITPLILAHLNITPSPKEYEYW